nr:MAG TPA: hypothetical protein [Caudoviricetes sp.]
MQLCSSGLRWESIFYENNSKYNSNVSELNAVLWFLNGDSRKNWPFRFKQTLLIRIISFVHDDYLITRLTYSMLKSDDICIEL